uniref:ATP synthase CF0 subunit I n=1 Tax=Dapsilanthus disjunctus TaxID=2919630 RepID=UPI001F1308B6|nr:ATP synthase CF0 subunit I [Dapsilanthus disjunctus]ULQ65070.1 ATP synthase CF0 subunit I [Dapsilanthus disjunctus]ULQ65158.1 ATP synthase CF0 subunit I [Dapsilanthus disjunctus]
MKRVTHSFVFLGHWPSAGSFGFNTDILATNLINLSVVIGVLIFFGKGVLKDLLDNRKHRILSTIRNSEELRRGAIKQLEKARVRLQKVEWEADEYRMNGYSEIEQKKAKLINAACANLERFANLNKETLHLEQERAMNQVRQRVFQQALQGALGTLNGCLNTELHFRMIRTNIRLLGSL